MVEMLIGILRESYNLLNEMAPYLVFGFFFAGILHIFIDTATIARHLGKRSFLSVVKASLFGIPLPLCSCGVIPAAISLRREGASKGAILSFLISTPTTGVDSIFATYSLLGAFFAGYRVLASFIAGVFAGTLANFFIKDEPPVPDKEEKKCELCESEEKHEHSMLEKVKSIFTYAFGALLSDTGAWIIIGIFIGGAISYFIPESFIETYLGSGWKSMVIMLIVGIPMYVCATGSIPIAAALMLKGMNPGAAFVFLMAGPATNAVSIALISKEIGRRAVVIYIVSIAICSLSMGYILNLLWGRVGSSAIAQVMHHKGGILPVWVEMAASIFLVGAIVFNLVKNRIQKNKGSGMTMH